MEPAACVTNNNCISWDSAYREVIDDRQSALVDRRPMRMPSVVVSDCSDEPVAYEHHHQTVSTTTTNVLLVRKLGHEDDAPDGAWSPAESPTPGDELFVNNLLAVRRLSDCSSSSSLATLDMDPYPASGSEAISDLAAENGASSPESDRRGLALDDSSDSTQCPSRRVVNNKVRLARSGT